MASLASSSSLLRSAPCTCTSSCSTSNRTKAALHLPKFPKVQSNKKLVQELNTRNAYVGSVQGLPHLADKVVIVEPRESGSALEQMYTILEAVGDQVEMHRNIGEQRNNWNALLLNSINLMTLTATTVAGLGAAAGGEAQPALKVSSTLLFAPATSMFLVMNKIQPLQLAEEQRNVVRLFSGRELPCRHLRK